MYRIIVKDLGRESIAGNKMAYVDKKREAKLIAIAYCRKILQCSDFGVKEIFDGVYVVLNGPLFLGSFRIRKL